MLGQVKVFDGNGKLKEIIQPVIDYELKTCRKVPAHPCPICGTVTIRPKFCGKKCADEQRAASNKKKTKAETSARAPRSKQPCCICKKITTRPKYCSPGCSVTAIRMKGRVGGWLKNPSREENK